MNRETGYLSDEMLDLLIAEVEQNELVMAPPDLKKGILDRISSERDVRKEYYQYCFRVAVSVAAAVILIFTLPDLQRRKNAEMPEVVQQEQLFFGKEEWGFYDHILNGKLIFDHQDRNKIFQ